jgi:hypothetical protein
LTSGKGVDRLLPAALFQFAAVTTPALSDPPIDVPVPTKSMLMTDGPPPEGAVTVRPADAPWLRAPLVPVTVTVNPPVGVVPVVDTVSVVVPLPVTLGGENDAVVFEGTPDVPNVTVPANPFTAPIVTV